MNENKTYESAADTDKYLYIERFTVGASEKWTSIAHFHDSIEIVFVLNGSYGVHVNTEECVLKKGEIAFIDSLTPHFYFASGEADIYAVVIGRQLLLNADGDEVFPSFLKESDGFEKIIKVIDSFGKYTKANEQIKIGFVNLLIGLMKNFYPTQKRSASKVTQTFIDVLKYINSNFKNEITLKGLSEKFGYDSNYFSFLFNKFTDMHLKEYINRRRIREVERIKTLEPKRSLTSIAFECGFASEKTFFRAYKAYRT